MAINFEYYKVFYYVTKYKKISLAAENLFVSQPAVTQIVQKLEEQLGGKLFVRSKSGMELTSLGKMLYENIHDSVEMLDNIEYNFSKYENLEEGEIRIRTGSNIAKAVLYDAIEKFGKEYPNIKIQISTGAPSESVNMLYTGNIDMVFVYLPYEVEYSNLQVIELLKKEYIFVMSKKYAEENNVKVDKISDLNKYSLIVPKRTSAIGKIFENRFKNIITNYHYEITYEQMKKELIMRDLGIGFMSKDTMKDELENGSAIEIKLSDSKIEGAIGVITLSDDINNFATKKLLDYMKKNI